MHLFESSLHPIVQIAYDEVVIIEHIWVKFLAFSPDIPKNLLHHLIALNPIVSSMHQMAADEVEAPISVLEENLHTTLILTQANFFHYATRSICSRHRLDPICLLNVHI